jgi:DNA-binding response OmpR family regulator
MERTYSLLLVDDEEANRFLLTRRLEQAGYHVTQADHGRHALKLMGIERFDLVLLDMNMPEMDGLATLDAIKSSNALLNIPVIMLTAANDRETIVHCLSLGAADYLIKPVNPVELKQRVSRCLETRAGRVEPTVQLTSATPAGARVLIVDDEPLNLKLLERRLGQVGFEAVNAEGGRQALEILNRESVDAVLLDVQMPEMDGFAVLRAIRANALWRSLPVLMLSADGAQDTVTQCYQLGADDYLVKPYHTPDLHIRLAVALDMKRAKQQAIGTMPLTS